MYTQQRPLKIKSIYAEAPVTTSAGTTGAAQVIDTSGIYACKVKCHTGPIYLSTLSTAPLTDNSIKINSSGFEEVLSQNGYISLYSTSTAPTREVILSY